LDTYARQSSCKNYEGGGYITMTFKSTITLVPTLRKFLLSDATALWANLQSLAVYIRKVGSNSLALPQCGRLFGKVDALSCHAIGIPTMLQGGVIQFSAQIKRMLHSPTVCLAALEVLARRSADKRTSPDCYVYLESG
jgi:hypothetical protein